ncbi:HPr family phosphocarrier protein [Secundilactobacillus odoratitofui]|uniref:HPr family phosphocarrier protein n=1 Tax=Secundilactobacillus odoratitofui TaxID=480930 RepID=UPI000704CCD3|nr:HPr family phosphocarrier protein [Secundilactobacillus odoratitofui]
MESTTVKVIAAGGLTGDAVNQLTNELSKYKFKIMLKYQGTTTIANSSLGVMSLGVPEGATISISVDGTADQLNEVVTSLVDNGFVATD